MADESVLKTLSAETRTKLRSTQILTSIPTIISELMQNAIDAGASQIDIGVDCAEWSCWVMDNGSGFTKEGLRELGQDSERGRYNSSKAHTPATLGTVSTFGFRGEALASMADLGCMEISSRTARSRDSWSVIVKGGKSLYTGPSIRWRRESPGTVVSIRDAFFSLPVRRQSHPAPNRTIELIRQELETYALVFPNISFSFQDTTKSKERQRPHISKIPRTRSTLAAFRHFFGRAFTECVHEISATSGQLHIEGFISLVGAHTKSHQFLYINRHPIAYCDLHRLIDTRFAASTFAKHAYDEGGETSLRPPVRRSSRKGEKKPVYVLNLVIPVHHIDNCLEPSKSAIGLDNKDVVSSFLSQTIQSFLVHHNFAPDNTRKESTDGNSQKKRKLNSTYVNAPSVPEAQDTPVHMMPVADAQMSLCNVPSTSTIDNRIANSYSQGPRHTPRTDVQIQPSSNRRTLQLTAENNSFGSDQVPNWLREALKANDTFALQEPKMPSVPPWVNQGTAYRSSAFHHNCHTSILTNHATPSEIQLGPSRFSPAQVRFRKDDLRQVRIISQVDCKFIACVVGLNNCSGGEKDGETHQEAPAAAGKTLILIDQHAADERVRVERFLKSVCRGFLSHQEGSGSVEMRELSPPVPVLLTKHEASRLAESLDFQLAFESWGFRFSGLMEIQSRLDSETQLDDGYVQVFVSAVPELVSEKLLLGKETQQLIQGYIGALESRDFKLRDPSTLQNVTDDSQDEETQWLKALRWCPRQLLDLINSKACRGAIMFNDPLNIEQCERLVKQLSATVFPFQCAHGRPSLVPLMCLGGGPEKAGLEWEKVATL